MSTPTPPKPTWSYLKNARDTQPITTHLGPWIAVSPSPVPPGITKEKFRAWCSDPSTNHVFYMPVIGLTPGLRVSQDNPVHEMWAFVGDYDCDSLIPMSDQEVKDAMVNRLKGKGIQPTYLSRTFSGKIRLVWEFEAPFPGDVEEVLNKCVELFVKESKAHAILPGFDETSKTIGQLFELGHTWQSLGYPPILAPTIKSIYFKATLATSLAPESLVQIPIEEVAAEVEKRWPGAWPGQFTVGSKGPLFWLNDGNPSIGAWVAENGVWAHSDRDHGWHPWSKLLGMSFVKQYEDKQIEGVLDSFAYDGNRYWVRSDSGRWFDHPKENMVPRLKKMGFGDTKPKGRTISSLDETLIAIQDRRRIDGSAPFLYVEEPVVQFKGRTFLNTSRAQAMKPVGTGESDPATYWPFLHEYLMDFLEPDPDYPLDPIHYLFSWMKYFWESALEGKPQPGQMIVVAGGINAGKTLFGKHVLGPMMGGHEDATKFVLGHSEFNRDLPSCGVWRIDDSSPPESDVEHSRYSDRMKSLVANMECPYRAMYRDNVTVPWLGRIFLTCNLNSDAQGILPKLSESMADKMMLFKARDREPGFFPPMLVLEATIARELPYFLEWLKNDYVIPPGVIPLNNRFGIAPFHHHEIVGVVREQSPEQNLADLLDIWAKEYLVLFPDAREWSGNPTQMMIELSRCTDYRASMPHSPRHAGSMLKKLRENGHWRIKKWNNRAKANVYTLDLGPER